MAISNLSANQKSQTRVYEVSMLFEGTNEDTLTKCLEVVYPFTNNTLKLQEEQYDHDSTYP